MCNRSLSWYEAKKQTNKQTNKQNKKKKQKNKKQNTETEQKHNRTKTKQNKIKTNKQTNKKQTKKKQTYKQTKNKKQNNLQCSSLFFMLSIEKKYRAIYEEIRKINKTINAMGRGPILFDIYLANKSQTDSNIGFIERT